MKESIIRELRDRQDYISGQELCDNLGVSRTAVWKIINQLKDEGYLIEAVQNKGYKIVEYPDIITSPEIKSQLRTRLIGQDVYSYNEIDSTNIQAKRLAVEGAKEGTVVIADKQLQGKGRRGKAWTSNENSGIWISLLLRPHITPSKAPMITLVAGLAVAKTLTNITQLDVSIKWPNDIVISNKKVCGILTEMSAEIDYVNYVVVGIGINVNTESFSEDLHNIATSIYLEKGEKINRSIIIAELLQNFEMYYNKFIEDKGFTNLREEYYSNCINIGKTVRVIESNQELIGKAIDINDNGELIILDEKGIEHIINSGDVSVRGLYGYV